LEAELISALLMEAQTDSRLGTQRPWSFKTNSSNF